MEVLYGRRPPKYLRNVPVFSKNADSINLFLTWDDCFRKPKLLLAANTLIYLNISANNKS